MEWNLLQKAEAFRYLYKGHQKEIRATIQKRDEELESILNYREKLWTESINLVNQNLVKMIKPKVNLIHPHPLLTVGLPATPQKSPAVTSND